MALPFKIPRVCAWRTALPFPLAPAPSALSHPPMTTMALAYSSFQPHCWSTPQFRAVSGGQHSLTQDRQPAPQQRIAPWAGTVPQEWNSGSISGPNARGAPTAGSSSKRISRRMSRFGRNPVAGITRPTASVTGWPAVVPVTARPSPTSLGMAAKEAAVQSVCPSTTSWRSRLPSWLRAGNRSRSPPPYRREASAARTAQLIRVQLNPLVPADWVEPTCRTRQTQTARGGQLRCRRPV